MAFLENTGLERLWGHIVHRLSLKADKKELKTKIDKSELETPIELSAELGLIDPVIAEDGAIYIDEDGTIYSL